MAEETATDGVLAIEVDGIPVSIEREVLSNDLDTLELLADIDDGNLLSIVRLMRRVFGEEQYRNIKASLRKDGRTSMSDMNDFMVKVFSALGDDIKN